MTPSPRDPGVWNATLQTRVTGLTHDYAAHCGELVVPRNGPAIERAAVLSLFETIDATCTRVTVRAGDREIGRYERSPLAWDARLGTDAVVM